MPIHIDQLRKKDDICDEKVQSICNFLYSNNNRAFTLLEIAINLKDHNLENINSSIKFIERKGMVLSRNFKGIIYYGSNPEKKDFNEIKKNEVN